MKDFWKGKKDRRRFMVNGIEGRIVKEEVKNRRRLKREEDGLM